MDKSNVLNWVVFAVFMLAGFWGIWVETRAYRFSGYLFYLFCGLIMGLPFTLWALVYYYSPKAAFLTAALLIVLPRLGVEWGIDQEEKAEKKDPVRWKEWRARRLKLHWIDRMFL